MVLIFLLLYGTIILYIFAHFGAEPQRRLIKEVEFCMLSLTISVYAAVILICNIFLGLRRGMLRSVVRLVMLLLTVPLAVWLTRLIAGVIGSSITPLVQSSLQGTDSQLVQAILSVGDSLDALVTMADGLDRQAG